MENRKSKYYLQNLIRCNIKEHKFEQNNQEIQMLHFQQHTSTCYVTPRARFVALHLRRQEQFGVQPSLVTSGETQDCPTNISLHPKVHGSELSSGGASFPTDCSNAMPRLLLSQQTFRWMLTEMKAAYGAHCTRFLSGGGGINSGWKSFFACRFVSQFTSFTEHYEVNFTHGPKFPHRHTYQTLTEG